MTEESTTADEFKLRRRTILKLMWAAGMGWRCAVATAAVGEAMRKRPIPSTGEMLPVVGLGTSGEFDVAQGERLEPLREVLRLFAALGGTLVDTAPAYGNAESIIGQLVTELSLTKKLFLATKVRTHGKQAGIEQMQTSELLLNKRPLDLIEVHSLLDLATQLDNLRRWKDAGRVRYIGVTHSRVSAHDELERLLQKEKLDFVQLNYSFTEPNAEQRLLPLAADKGVAVIANRPFENGALFRRVKGKALPAWSDEFDCKSWAQFSLKYVLSHPAVTCVIPATSNPKNLVDNMGAGVGRLPDANTRRRMREYGASL